MLVQISLQCRISHNNTLWLLDISGEMAQRWRVSMVSERVYASSVLFASTMLTIHLLSEVHLLAAASAIWGSSTCSSQCCRLVQKRPCDNACKRSLAICCNRGASCPVVPAKGLLQIQGGAKTYVNILTTKRWNGVIWWFTLYKRQICPPESGDSISHGAASS